MYLDRERHTLGKWRDLIPLLETEISRIFCGDVKHNHTSVHLTFLTWSFAIKSTFTTHKIYNDITRSQFQNGKKVSRSTLLTAFSSLFYIWLRPWEKGSYGFDVVAEKLRHKVTTSSVDVAACNSRREFSTWFTTLRSPYWSFLSTFFGVVSHFA